MRKLTFAERAWEEYLYWQANDKRALKHINILLKDIIRNGNSGIGKLEPLRHYDGWSRHIDGLNRLAYRLKENETIEILQCKGHYDD